jgi:hypothetical protein
MRALFTRKLEHSLAYERKLEAGIERDSCAVDGARFEPVAYLAF